MDLQVSPGAIFNVRPDGVVEMPIWGAELMFTYLVYTPYTWVEIESKLKAHASFGAHLTTYNLIYSLCTAINTRNTVLLDLVWYDRHSGTFKLPPQIEQLYNGRCTPWSFWGSTPGLELRRRVSNLSSFVGQATGSALPRSYMRPRRDWEEFRRLVDIYSSVPSAQIDWLAFACHPSTDTSPSLFEFHTQALGIRNFEARRASEQPQNILSTRSSRPYRISRDRPGMAIPQTPTNSHSTSPVVTEAEPHHSRRGQARIEYSESRKKLIEEALEAWKTSDLEAVDQRCVICLEDMVPTPNKMQSTTGDSPIVEVPIQTPCKHYFGLECLKIWLLEYNTCPMCRAVLIVFEHRVERTRSTAVVETPPAVSTDHLLNTLWLQRLRLSNDVQDHGTSDEVQ